MCHRGKDSHVGPGLLLQPECRVIDHLDPARIDHDQPRSVLFDGGFHLQPDDRVGFGGVRAGDDEDVIFGNIRSRVAHGR